VINPANVSEDLLARRELLSEFDTPDIIMDDFDFELEELVTTNEIQNDVIETPTGTENPNPSTSQTPHRSTTWRKRKRKREEINDDKLILDMGGDVIGAGRSGPKLLKKLKDKPKLVSKFLTKLNFDSSLNSSTESVTPLEGLAHMHGTGLTVEQYNKVEFLLNVFKGYPSYT
jgi:hypothetical protein